MPCYWPVPAWRQCDSRRLATPSSIPNWRRRSATCWGKSRPLEIARAGVTHLAKLAGVLAVRSTRAQYLGGSVIALFELLPELHDRARKDFGIHQSGVGTIRFDVGGQRRRLRKTKNFFRLHMQRSHLLAHG